MNKEKWNALSKPTGTLIRQGYLLIDPDKTIRVRFTDSKSYLTIKGPSRGATRQEYEYEIPWVEAEELFNTCSDSKVIKVRYEIVFKGKKWEVDMFQGENEGLIIAEIELKSESEYFEIPDWIEKEVTEDKIYYNSSLSVRPYTT